MELKDINCSGFTFNPKEIGFVEKLQQASPLFKIDVKGLSTKRFLTYVTLMYDDKSELRRNISNLSSRKILAGLASGFVLDQNNHFPALVEDALIGKTIECARAAAEYCVLSQGFNATLLGNYQRIMIEVLALSHDPDKISVYVGMISKIQKEIESLENKILGGDESEIIRKALYQSSKQTSLNLHPEAIVAMIDKGSDLSEFNPHGDYKLQPLKYAGEYTPNDQVQ
jgi:hypothetical protein